MHIFERDRGGSAICRGSCYFEVANTSYSHAAGAPFQDLVPWPFIGPGQEQ